MSEIKHPPLDLRLSIDASNERIFAEEAYQLLHSFGMPLETKVDQAYVTLPVTERFDIITGQQQDVEMALRIKGTPVFSGMSEEAGLTPSSDYFVMELQVGEIEEAGDEVIDEDFTWRDYLMVVVDTTDANNVSVLDATTGKDLSGGDLTRALFTLQVMRQEFRSMSFEEKMVDPATLPDYELPSMSLALPRHFGVLHLGEFVSETMLELSSCDACGLENAACEHNPETLN